MSGRKAWWSEGVKFQCQGSGQCCISRGEYGFVFMSKKDRSRMAKVLGLKTAEFTKKYCDNTKGAFHLKEDPARPECMFLEKNRCTVYEGRPTQCRTWPFWPDTMSPKAWTKEVSSYCPGVGKGKVIPAEKIQQALNDQKATDDAIVAEAQSPRSPQ